MVIQMEHAMGPTLRTHASKISLLSTSRPLTVYSIRMSMGIYSSHFVRDNDLVKLSNLQLTPIARLGVNLRGK